MLLTLLVFIKIPLSVFPWVFLWRSGVEVFWGVWGEKQRMYISVETIKDNQPGAPGR